MTTFSLKAGTTIHFIALGGAVMHNLALELHAHGYKVTGSDDAFFDPSKSRLEQAGLLPESEGWDPNRVHTTTDLIILGMHARPDNPELLKAQSLGVQIMSFPEFMYNYSSEKKRVAIAGSHGKTTTTSMVMHALQMNGVPHDYLVGALLEGYETMVKLSDADMIVLESDEYLSSPLDSRPKMLHYKPHVAVITGVEWDHVNVFATYESYIEAFKNFIESIPESGVLFYAAEDKILQSIIQDMSPACNTVGYSPFSGVSKDHGNFVEYEGESYEVQIFGQHNFANLKAAALVCREIGVPIESFLVSMKSFSGADKRMQIVFQSDEFIIIQDFAHAPSKVRATVKAVREKYPDAHLIAALELHTFSSLNKDFLPNYHGTLTGADQSIVFYDPKSSTHKKLPLLSNIEIQTAFNDPNLFVVNNRAGLLKGIDKSSKAVNVILLMSSAQWGGGKFSDLVDHLSQS